MMIEKPPMDPFFERALIGRSPEEKTEAYQRRDKELTRAAQNLLPENDQEQGE